MNKMTIKVERTDRTTNNGNSTVYNVIVNTARIGKAIGNSTSGYHISESAIEHLETYAPRRKHHHWYETLEEVMAATQAACEVAFGKDAFEHAAA